MVQYQGPFDFEKVKALDLYPTSREGIIWLDVLITPLGNSAVPITGFLVQIQDITERNKAGVNLRETNEYLNNLFDYANAPIITWDTGFHITRFNHAFERLTGRSQEEVLGMTLDFLFPDKTRTASMALIQKAVGGERWETVEIPILTKEGNIRTVIWNSANVLDPDGRTISTIAQGTDITERKRALDALLQTNNKLAMLNNITRHDILNQLMGLRTYLELSKMDVIDPVFLNYIQKEEQAAEAIQWMIEFTRDYQDIGGQGPKWHILSDTISSAISQLKPPDVEINVDVNRVEVFADPLMEKVFYNLMENSLRHGEHVTHIDFSVKESESGLILTYADNGVGVTADDKKKLFVKGFGKHTGLGLFLSKEILSITGITITENGEPGNGARFEMAVPKGAWRIVGKIT
jgi:PAS domain S-box-containing protein